VRGPVRDHDPVRLDLDDPAGEVVGLTMDTAATGWHTLRMTGSGLPADGSSFELRVTYTAGDL